MLFYQQGLIILERLTESKQPHRDQNQDPELVKICFKIHNVRKKQTRKRVQNAVGFSVHAPGESFTLPASGTSEGAGEGPSRTCPGFNPVGIGTNWPHSGHKTEVPPALHLISQLLESILTVLFIHSLATFPPTGVTQP